MKFGWKTRAALVLSAVWLCLVFLLADDYRRFGQVIGLGFLPLVMFWGICWAFAGWRAQRPVKAGKREAQIVEARWKQNIRIRTFIAVVLILVIGVFAANWQFHAAENESRGDVIGYWFGEWLVYGLFAYFAFRLIPRRPPGLAVIAAAFVVVCGVNYKAHRAISEDREALDSLAKAAPLIIKIQSGGQVSDQEVKDADVGMIQPILLALASYSRDVVTITATYTKALSELELERMLSPKSLESSRIRFQTHAKLKVWQQATADYKTQLDAANARGKLGIKAAQLQMPVALANSASKGFEKSSAELSAYITGLVTTGNEARRAVEDILDLMESSKGNYIVDKGPPATLLFNDEETLIRYRQLMSAVMALSQREAEAQAGLIKAQSNLNDKMADLLKQ